MATAENIRDDVIGNLANRTDLTDNLIYRFINQAQTRVSRLKAFDELSTCIELLYQRGIVKQQLVDYNLRKRIRKIINVIPFDINSQNRQEDPLRRISTVAEWNRLKAGYTNQSRTGEPQIYLYWKHPELEIFPTPDDTYKLQVFLIQYPIEVTEANKTEELSIFNIEDIIINLVTAYCMYRLGRQQDGNIYYGLYKDTIKEKISEEADYGDYEMAGVKVNNNLGISDYWRDPFFKGHYRGQVE